ncbi:hypothetical protein [Streptomyces sp. NBC_00370]|uniref:hypothetical protein n=1 Tax=Streptomyces sp. NBC_00370 TaxID=2975728 RepID=UPI002E26B728
MERIPSGNKGLIATVAWLVNAHQLVALFTYAGRSGHGIEVVLGGIALWLLLRGGSRSDSR